MKLNGRAKNIAKRFIESPRLIGIYKVGAVLCYTVSQFMTNNIYRNKRISASIAIPHGYTVPAGVHPGLVPVYIAHYFGSISVIAITVMLVQKIIIGHFCSPVCIGSCFIYLWVYIVPIVIGVFKVYRAVDRSSGLCIHGLDSTTTGNIIQHIFIGRNRVRYNTLKPVILGLRLAMGRG